MTRKEIEQAAREYCDDNKAWLKPFASVFAEFARQQVNAALEAAESHIIQITSVESDYGDLVDKCSVLVAIRALKIPEDR